jgi:hypothetical protein
MWPWIQSWLVWKVTSFFKSEMASWCFADSKMFLSCCHCHHMHRFCWFITDATHKSIVSLSNKWNAVLKNLLWKGQKTVGCLLLFCSLLLLASGGVTHFVLMPLHFLTARRLNCYVCGPTRQVSVVLFVTMQGSDSTCHWKSQVLVLSWSHIFYIICIL